jgi:hypothetical protein
LKSKPRDKKGLFVKRGVLPPPKHVGPDVLAPPKVSGADVIPPPIGSTALGGAAGGAGDAAAATAGVEAAEGLTAVAGAAAGVGAVLAGVVGGAALVIGIFAAFGAGIAALTSKFLDAQKELAKYNGALAAGFAIAQARQIHRDIKVGNETSAGTTTLISAFEDLKDAFVPVRVLLTNMVSGILTPMVRLLTKVLNFLKPLIEGINKMVLTLERWFGIVEDKKDPPVMPAQVFFQNAARGIVAREPLPREAGRQGERWRH